MGTRMSVAVATGETTARGKRYEPMPPESIMTALSPQKRAAQNRKLLAASLNGDAEGVREALAQGACITAKNPRGRTALMLAADGEGLERMLSNAEEVDRRLAETAEALLKAARAACNGRFGDYITSKDRHGWDARSIAEHWRHRSVMEQIDAALRQ